MEEMNKKEQEQEIEMIRKLDKNLRTWEQQKLLEKSKRAKKELTQEEREQNKKRMWLEGTGEHETNKKRKTRKYAIIANSWGEQETDTNVDLVATEQQEEPTGAEECSPKKHISQIHHQPESSPIHLKLLVMLLGSRGLVALAREPMEPLHPLVSSPLHLHLLVSSQLRPPLQQKSRLSPPLM